MAVVCNKSDFQRDSEVLCEEIDIPHNSLRFQKRNVIPLLNNTKNTALDGTTIGSWRTADRRFILEPLSSTLPSATTVAKKCKKFTYLP